MMKSSAITFLATLLLLASAQAVYETDDPVKEERDAIAKRLDMLSNIDSLKPDEAISYLGDGLRRMGDPSIYHFRDEVQPVYMATRQKLLSIPGHAEYYAQKVEEARKTARGPEPAEDPEYVAKLDVAFETLGHMPSEETVNVLGRYMEYTADVLDDAAIRRRLATIRSSDSGVPQRRELSMCAARAYSNLGIEQAPANLFLESIAPNGLPDVNAWKQWWTEVKTGRRSYKFKGDDHIYPTGTTAPPYAGRRGEPGGTREHARPNSRSQSSPPFASSPSVVTADTGHLWPWAAGILILTAVGWWWLRRRGEVKK